MAASGEKIHDLLRGAHPSLGKTVPLVQKALDSSAISQRLRDFEVKNFSNFRITEDDDWVILGIAANGTVIAHKATNNSDSAGQVCMVPRESVDPQKLAVALLQRTDTSTFTTLENEQQLKEYGTVCRRWPLK
eukprot:TRINITY_DN77347_c0_g1_i1.p2 TRINITY_DN77347_c0_g1~~TRINITY_DN77347_c0_g1_i1.p2  ORF type:complete len:133 (-),score=5.71 TRINITY_DN77347_c0_g1_i1:123-521(-)